MKVSENIVSSSKPETLNNFYENINTVSDAEKVMFDDMIDLQIEKFFKVVPLLDKRDSAGVLKSCNKLGTRLVLSWIGSSLIFSFIVLYFFNFSFSFNTSLILSWVVVVCFILVVFEEETLSKIGFLRRLGLSKSDNSIKSQYVQLFMLKMLLNNKYSIHFLDMPNADLVKRGILSDAIKTLSSGSNIESLLNSYLESAIDTKSRLESVEGKKELENKRLEDELFRREKNITDYKEAFNIEANEICEAKNIILGNLSK